MLPCELRSVSTLVHKTCRLKSSCSMCRFIWSTSCDESFHVLHFTSPVVGRWVAIFRFVACHPTLTTQKPRGCLTVLSQKPLLVLPLIRTPKTRCLKLFAGDHPHRITTACMPKFPMTSSKDPSAGHTCPGVWPYTGFQHPSMEQLAIISCADKKEIIIKWRAARSQHLRLFVL